jgi:hypothetical protein
MSNGVGTLEVLNVGLGHVTVTFGKDDPVERERARRMVEDMLRRGYSLFIEREGALVPVRGFDAGAAAYIVTDVPAPTTESQVVTEAGAFCHCGRPKGHRGAHRKTRVPVAEAKVVAIGRSAGG